MSQVLLLILSALLVLFAGYVYRAQSHHRVNRRFAVFALCISAWALGIGGLQTGHHLDAWGALAFSAAAFIPACFIGFLSVYPDNSISPSRPSLVAVFLVAAIFAAIAWTTDLLVYDTTLSPDGLMRKTGAAYPFFSVYLLGSWVIALSVLARKWRRAVGQARAQLQYLWLGLLLSVSTALAFNLILPLITGRSSLSWLGPYSAVIFLALTAHSVIHHRLLDLRPVINRGAAYVLVISLVVIATLMVGRALSPAWAARPLGAQRDVIVGLAVTLVLLTPLPLRLLSLLLDSYLLRPRVDQATVLAAAARSLSRLMQPDDLVAELRRTVTAALAADWVLVALHPSDAVPPDHVPPAAVVGIDVTALLAHAHALVEASGPRPLYLVDAEPDQPHLRASANPLRAARVGAVAMLGRRDRPLGILVLGPRRRGDAYFAEDYARLESLLDIVSIALENAVLYRQQLRLLEYANRLIESLDSAVITVTPLAHVDRINTAARVLLDLPPHVESPTLVDLPSEVGWALTFTLSTDFRLRNLELSLDTSGGPVPVLISTARLMDAHGAPDGALAVLTDLSATKELERQRRRAEQLDAMTRLYAGVAHEIRTPLTAISSFVSMLPERFNDPEYRAAAVRILPAEVTRIAQLADRLRLLIPERAPDIAPLDLAPLLADAVLLYRSAGLQQGVTLSVRCSGGLPQILGDPGLLAQLFANLLRNAIEAMPNGGRILVEALVLLDCSDGPRLTVRVVDSGIGLDATTRPRLFEPFFTTKASGTGLGLALCQKIVEAHGAVLTLLPRQDRCGTIAEISFPVASHKPPP